MQKAKLFSEEALQNVEERRKVKGKGESIPNWMQSSKE